MRFSDTTGRIFRTDVRFCPAYIDNLAKIGNNNFVNSLDLQCGVDGSLLMKKATRQQIKTHNNRLILKSIYDNPEISRADIARLTGLTRTTVSDVVSDLIADGLVEEAKVGPSAGGKPPILLNVVDDARMMIGIDLANSEFRGAIVNLRGQIKQRVSLPIDEQDGQAALDLVYQLIDELLQEQTILGIGIGTPGLMDAHKGIVRNAVNLNWTNLPLRDLLQERYNLPVYIANDSQVAALAEHTFGSSKDADTSNLVVIKIGRGIGAGLIINRQLYYGDGFGAGEIGHVVVVEDGELCRCGNRGCLETVASSRAMVRAAQQRYDESHLDQFAARPEDITTNTLLKAYEAGDPVVQAVVRQAGGYLAIAVANLVGALNIERIVIAGSSARFGEGLVTPVRERLDNLTLPALASRTDLEVSHLGTDIVILGAAALLLANELGLN
jgi:N-acetylglucosamine repressor